MIYENIRRKCEAMGITVCELERRVGLGYGTVGQWSWKHNRFPRVDTLLIVADFFGCTLDELVRDQSVRSDKKGG